MVTSYKALKSVKEIVRSVACKIIHIDKLLEESYENLSEDAGHVTEPEPCYKRPLDLSMPWVCY